MIVETQNQDLDLMGLGYSDMDVIDGLEDNVEIMGIDEEESYIVPREIVETIDGMPDEDIVNDLVQYPELMGAFFKRILKKHKRRRRLLKKKLRGMSKRQRRKYMRKLRRKRRRKITKKIILRFAPGGRIIRAIKLRKKLKQLKRAKKKRLSAKRAKRRSSQPEASVAPIAPMEIYQKPAPQVYEKRRRATRTITRGMPPPKYEDAGEMEEPQEEQQSVAPSGDGMKKMLPLVAIAGAGLLFMTMKKR